MDSYVFQTSSHFLTGRFRKNNFQQKVQDNLEKCNQLEDSIQAENSQHRRVQEADFKMSNTTDK